MPNHFHSILEITQMNNPVGATLVVAPDNTAVAPDNTAVIPENTAVAPGITAVVQDIVKIEPNNNDVEPNNINVNVGATTRVAPTQIPKTIGDIMDAFKSITTVKYIHGVKTLNWQPFNRKLWQRNYYERIIRDNDSYQRIKQYITDNPSN
jgi:putative transposase